MDDPLITPKEDIPDVKMDLSNIPDLDSLGSLGELSGPVWALISTERIRRLKSKYFQAVDGKDYEAIASMFTADACVDFSGEIAHHIGHHGVTSAADPDAWLVSGGEAASLVIRESVDQITTVHQGHDSQIDITSEMSARGRWSLYDMLEFPDETMHGFGQYDEEYRFMNGEWKISGLTLTRTKVLWVQSSAG